MPELNSVDAGTRRVAGIQTLALLGLCALTFRSEIGTSLQMAAGNWEAAHLLAAPVVILILLWRRRRDLARQSGGGSIWGPVIITLSLALWLVSTWPFNFAYPRRLALVPAVGGIIVAVGGWRALRLCLPMLLILLIAIPLDSRHYAVLTARLEQQTLAAACATLEALPGVLIDRQGLDVSYIRGSESGTIALGEPMPGASLLLSYLTVIVFVTSVRKRPRWQLAGMAILALPMVLLCDYVGLLVQGLVTIYTGAGPLSNTPRAIAAVISLLFAYGLSVLALWTLQKVVVQEDRPATDGGHVTEPAPVEEPVRGAAKPLWRSLSSGVPLASAVLFLVATVGLHPGVEALIRHYRKLPIELRKPLREFDAGKMPSFRLVSDLTDITPDEEADEGGISERLRLVFEDLAPDETSPVSPDLVLTVTYISDPDRPVPYPPELIYRQHGAIVENVTDIAVDTPDLAPDPWEVPARRLELKDGDEHLVLVYVYCCNGAFFDDREEVRFAIGWPGDRYIYFSRVEALTVWPPGMSRSEATERCERLLSEAVPILVRDHLPQREDLRR